MNDAAFRRHCRCLREAGDRPCPTHPSCEACGCPPECHAVDDQELRGCRECECEQYVDAWKAALDAAEAASLRGDTAGPGRGE